MRRRDFIAGLAGSAAWPLAARGQQGERVRRVGVLAGGSEKTQGVLVTAFRDGLAKLGWAEGRSLRIDVRFAAGDAYLLRANAAELVRLTPEALVTNLGPGITAAQEQTQTIPIIIAAGGDVFSTGRVKNIARPEGNITGVAHAFSSIGGKWVELLKDAVPRLERIGAIYNPELSSAVNPGGYVVGTEEAARVLGVKVVRISYRDAVDVMRAVDSFATEPNSGLIVNPVVPNPAIRETLVRLAVERRLPAMYFDASFAAEGGLMSYASNSLDLWRRASYFVDRILRGAKVSDLPVEYPTRFELVVNLRTARAIGLSIPESFLLRADQVIE
jgi:putative tryptophan/tyrosine transport system substrate-binding protein